MKSFDNKGSTCIDHNVESNGKDCKFEVGVHLRISKQKHFCKRLYSTLVRSFLVKKIKKYCSKDILY